MEAGGGAGGRVSPLLFGGGLQEPEEEPEETLVLYCGSEEEEEAAGVQRKARVAASLGLDQDFSERDSYGQDPLWLVSNTLQLNIQSEDDVGETVILADSEVVSEGGMLESDALLLLNDSVNFLPISEGLPSSDKLLESINERQPSKMATPVKKYSVKPPSRASHTDYSSRERSKTNFPSRSSPKMYSKGTQGEQAPIVSAVSMTSPTSGAMKEKTLVLGKENATLIKNHQGIGTVVPGATSRTVPKVDSTIILQQEEGVRRDPAMKFKLVDSSKSSVDEDDQYEEPFVGPSLRWPSQPRSYRGAKQRDGGVIRKNVRKIIPGVDTDGETSGMGSSVDEPIESSTESASEAPVVTPSFLQPRPSSSSSRGPSTSPVAVKKRRGGWPKGRKRKPEIPGVKPPKAPLTAYVLFLNERRKYYKETRPELSFGAVTKLLGAEWSSLTPEQKAAFVTRSEQDKRRYRNELQAYRQSHDYQLLLRKKRIKNVIKRGGTTTEESSDFTDEIDDDDSEELYCRICDQLFTSLHNKREHLYGKQHLQVNTNVKGLLKRNVRWQQLECRREGRETASTVAHSLQLMGQVLEQFLRPNNKSRWHQDLS
ncbi:putative high mobility group protein 20A-like [Penaeus vannamei]|uniref:Putative high mobility group protein 20A-like n=1 Tax=Penaeus vannamei TaxID=6689 RepID=A0A3R7LV05_PENVA|nr:putative high mobility group protein 20A-like [Penaeus vannamei]